MSTNQLAGFTSPTVQYAGSREKRTEFLFKVYDVDKDGGISKEELYQFFLSSLMVSVDKNIQEVSKYEKRATRCSLLVVVVVFSFS